MKKLSLLGLSMLFSVLMVAQNLPKAILNGSSGPGISLKAIAEASSLELSNDKDFQILSFIMSLPSAGGDIEFSSKDGHLTPEMVVELAKLRSKQRVSFSKIMVMNKETKETREINPLYLKIE